MTPSGIEPATFRFVAQHLNHCATAVPTCVIYQVSNYEIPEDNIIVTKHAGSVWCQLIVHYLFVIQNKKKLIRTSQTKFYRSILRSLTYATRERIDKHDLTIMRHTNTDTNTHTHTYIETHICKDITASDNSRHFSLQPFRLRSGTAALAAIPARSESRSMRFVLYVAVNTGFSLTIFSARCWKYFPSTRNHASHLTNTLFTEHWHYTN